MLKYYVLLLLIAGIVLIYVFLEDPCHKQLRTDFSDKYPSYRLLDADARDGSPESVHCHVFYQKPGSETTYEEVWLYENPGSGWRFSRVLEIPGRERTGAASPAS